MSEIDELRAMIATDRGELLERIATLEAQVEGLKSLSEEQTRWIEQYKHRDGYKPFYLDPKRWPQSYPAVYEKALAVAREHGYALAVHGSTKRDLDLIAVPWTDEAVTAEALAEEICAACHAVFGPREAEAKPCGRLAWSLHLGGGAYIDLSVIALSAPTPTTDYTASTAPSPLNAYGLPGAAPLAEKEAPDA